MEELISILTHHIDFNFLDLEAQNDCPDETKNQSEEKIVLGIRDNDLMRELLHLPVVSITNIFSTNWF